MWSRSKQLNFDIPGWQVVTISFGAPIFGWLFYSALVNTKKNTWLKHRPAVLWFVTGALIAGTGQLLRTFSLGISTFNFLNILLFATFTTIILGATVYGCAAFAHERELLRLLNVRARELQSLRSDASDFASLQTNALKTSIEEIVIPEMERLRSEIEVLLIKPLTFRMEELQWEVNAYSKNVIRSTSHQISESISANSSDSTENNKNQNDAPGSKVSLWGALDLLLSARVSLPLAMTGLAVLFISVSNLGCTGRPLVAVLAGIGVAVPCEFVGRLAFLRKKPWSFLWLIFTALLILVVFRSIVNSGGNECSWAAPTSPLERGIVFSTVMIVILSLAAVFEGARRASEASAKVAQSNIEIVEVTKNLQASGNVTRIRVAKLLHGSVQGKLAALSLALKIHIDAKPEESLKSDPGIENQIMTLMNELEIELKNLLIADPLANTSLERHLKALTNSWNGLLEVSFDVDSETTEFLMRQPEMTTRVTESIDEAVTNANRHASARKIDIRVHYKPNQAKVILRVTDDGEAKVGHVVPGYGLNAVADAGGVWTLKPNANQGSTLEIAWPVES